MKQFRGRAHPKSAGRRKAATGLLRRALAMTGVLPLAGYDF